MAIMGLSKASTTRALQAELRELQLTHKDLQRENADLQALLKYEEAAYGAEQKSVAQENELLRNMGKQLRSKAIALQRYKEITEELNNFKRRIQQLDNLISVILQLHVQMQKSEIEANQAAIEHISKSSQKMVTPKVSQEFAAKTEKSHKSLLEAAENIKNARLEINKIVDVTARANQQSKIIVEICERERGLAHDYSNKAADVAKTQKKAYEDLENEAKIIRTKLEDEMAKHEAAIRDFLS